MSTFITLIPRVSTYYFSEADNNGLNILDQASYYNQILPWQDKSPYLQKSLMTDIITIEAHTQLPTAGVGLYVCDIHQNVIATIDLNVAPYKKGFQTVTGNNYTNPFDGTVTPLVTALWSFTFNDFSGFVTPDTISSIYYLKLANFNATDSKEYFSEPIFLCSPTKDTRGFLTRHENTLIFEAQYSANRSGNTNVIISGWCDDYPTNAVPYSPVFSTRCEAYILPLDPTAVNIGYLKQQYDTVFISGQQKPKRILRLGELSLGITDYMLQMITEFMICDTLWIGIDHDHNYNYKLSGANSQTSPADIWKSKRDENRPLLYANTVIEPATLAQQAMVAPTPTIAGRVHDGVHALEFA